eukprot:TRINITY_DN66848_c0_g1_i1.p1 TRINITY_DN66848_c0_g1~~TRINITY_DN66848_c0_g1_i1.p1  ORF type:complete len:104 (-),score=12.79 TRINITY_DN66848_c0_g1_i1:15-284(-)
MGNNKNPHRVMGNPKNPNRTFEMLASWPSVSYLFGHGRVVLLQSPQLCLVSGQLSRAVPELLHALLVVTLHRGELHTELVAGVVPVHQL